MSRFLSSLKNAPLDLHDVVDEHGHHEFHGLVEEKFHSQLAPYDQFRREGHPNYMEDHHALD
jgi:hypothetical protein